MQVLTVLARAFDDAALSVLFRAQLPGHPLPRVDPQAGALHMLPVELPAAIVLAVALHPVVSGVVGYFEHVIEKRVGLGFSG